MIRERTVVSLQDQKPSKKLQVDHDLSLTKAINQAGLSEAVKKQALLRNDSEDVEDSTKSVGAVKVKAKKTQKLKDETTKEESPTLPSSTRCKRWGNPLTCKQANCPAKDATCYKCSKRSRCGTVCKSSKTVGEVQEDGNLFFGEIGIETNNTFWSVDLLSVNAQQVRLKIDTGADVTVILDKIYEALRPSPAHFSLSLRWCFGGKIQKRDKSTEREIFVVNDARNALSGRPATEALAIVKQG